MLRGLPLAARAPVSALAAVLAVRMADESAAFLPFGTLEAFRDDLGLSYSQAGAVLAAMWPGGLAGSAFSSLADRRSRRAIAAGGALAFALSLAGFAAAPSFLALVVASALMGAASTAMVDAAEVALVELVELAGDDLRRHLARSNLLGVAGDVLGPGLVAVMAALGLPWRATFWVASSAMVVYALVLARSPLPRPAGPGSHSDAVGDGEGTPGLAAVVRDPRVWVVGLVLALMGPFDEPLIGFTISLLEQARGASPAVAAAIALVSMGGGGLSYTVLARRLEGVHHDRLLLRSAWAMSAGALAIALSPSVAVVAVAAFVASVGLNLAWLAVQHRSLTLRPGQVGTTNAVLGAIEMAGFWIPVAIGAVADTAGLPAAVGTYGILGAALVGLAWLSSRSLRR